MESSSLAAAWGALPDEPAILYYGKDLMTTGKKIDILDYKAFTEGDKLDALNSLVPNKHALVLAPSSTGSFVPVSEMATDALIFSATLKARTESSAIIDSEIRPVFDELVNLLQDSDSGVAAQALEELQDMVFDQTLRQMSKGNIKYCFIYVDDMLNDCVMVVGNRKTLSFDLKKIKALQIKQHNLLYGIPTPQKSAQKALPAKGNSKPKNAKAKPKPKSPSEESSSESESSSSSSSSSEDSEQEGLIPEGPSTPIMASSSALPKGSVDQILEDSLLQETVAAKALLREAQQKVAALEARALGLAPTPVSINQTSGPALKTPHPAREDFIIPKKSAMLKEADNQHSRKAESSRKAEKAAAKLKKSKRTRKHSKKHKHAKKAKASKKHSKKPSSDDSSSMSTDSQSESDSDEPPPKDEATSQVLCSVCCKNTAHPVLK